MGTLIATKTVIATVPFRPSWDSVICTGVGETPATDVPFGGTWYDPVLGACVHGFNFVVSFDFGGMGVTLPDELIYGVEFDTNLAGNNPIGAPGGYDSLNLAFTTDLPSIGTNVEPASVFWDTSFGPFYCDGGTGGTDTFRRDAGCWGTFTPVVLITIDTDSDGDGVNNGDDLCPSTVIPEGVAPGGLNPNHWALTNVDGDFDTVRKGKGRGPNRSYTIEDTAGCSCEQIIEIQGLGNGHLKHGCSISAMDDWVDAVNMP